MLFRVTGIRIASVLTAIGMAIGVLVKVLLPSGGIEGGGGKPQPKDEKSLKKWIENKLVISAREIRCESSRSIEW